MITLGITAVTRRFIFGALSFVKRLSHVLGCQQLDERVLDDRLDPP
jgi:hypothetical protein